MSTRSQLTKDLNESIKSSVGNKVKILFKNVVRLETKGDKTENRVLVFSPCRILLLTAKVPTKVSIDSLVKICLSRLFEDRLPLPLPGNPSAGKQTRQSAEPDDKRQSVLVSDWRRFDMQRRSRQHDFGVEQRHPKHFPDRPASAHHQKSSAARGRRTAPNTRVALSDRRDSEPYPF
jgi:hypothetical protein